MRQIFSLTFSQFIITRELIFSRQIKHNQTTVMKMKKVLYFHPEEVSS